MTEPFRTHISLKNEEEVIYFCVIHFLDEAIIALDDRGRFSVALSGGSTPKKFYEALTKSPEVQALNWKNITLFWSDERAVAPENDDSNYKMAMQFFSKAPFCDATIVRMQAERPDREEAALDYENAIKEHCSEGRIDLVYLGIGEDGHTASLFPDTKALTVADKLVCPNFIPAVNTWRMTMTFEAINNARNIVVIATGKKKAKILHEILDGKNQNLYPAQRISGKETPAFFVSDM